MIAIWLAMVVARGTAFSCTPVAVWDGDGPIWCKEGPRIRLAGIAAREIDETCKTGHPCPTSSGRAARDGLVELLGGARGMLPSGHIRVRSAALRCVSDGGGGGNRTAAWCRTSTGLSLNCAMVSAGLAARWDPYWRRARCP